MLLGAHILGWTLGLLAGMMVWFVLDFWRGWRVMHWLTQPQQSVPTQWGIWGEVADRVRRLQRLQDRQLSLSQSNLDQFLSAIQASPNGVLILDAEMRITWCNGMAAQHLGIDPARDMAQWIGNLVRHPDFNQYLQQARHDRAVIIDGRDHRPEPHRRAARLPLRRARWRDDRARQADEPVDQLRPPRRRWL